MSKVLIGSIAGPPGADGATGPQGLPGTGLGWANVVADFEADPTGVIDSTPLIQDAIDSLAPNGGKVYNPPGVYSINPPSLTVPALRIPSNVKIVGDGFGASVYRKDSDGIILDFSGKGPLSQTEEWSLYQGLEGMKLDGNGHVGALIRLYYVQGYYEKDVFLTGNADVSVDCVQFWDSRIDDGLYLYGGSTEDSAISGAQACTHLLRNSAAPATTLSSNISGTITALPVVAIDAAMPAGVVQVWNAAGDLQNFTTVGAVSGATSIPVTSAAVTSTFVSGDVVNGFGWSGDNNNALVYDGCHWEDNVSGAIWITDGIDNTATPNGIKIVNTKIEEDGIGYAAPQVQVDDACGGILVDGLDMYMGGFLDAFDTPVIAMQLHSNYGDYNNINLTSGEVTCVSTGIDSAGHPNKFLNLFEYWPVTPTVAGFNGGSGSENILIAPTVAGTFDVDYQGTYTILGAGSDGTVTEVSVASANGFAGTVADDTTTPAITIKTTVTGLLKGNGTAVSAATSGTDYAPATTGTSILKASSGGFAAASAGTDYAPATSGSGLLKGNGSGGFSAATSGTDFAPATTGTSLLKASSGGFANAAAGTDYVAPTGSGAGLSGITASQVGAIALSLAAALGDTIAASASGAWAKLSGNTTATKKFYTQTGTGSVSAAPAWNTLASGDIPNNAANTTGTAANFTGGATLPAYLAPKVTALTDGSSIATNAALGNDFSVTIAGNRTMAAPSNPVDGQKIIYAIKQDGTGSRTMTWTTGTGGFSFGSVSAPTLTTTANDVDLVAFRYTAGAGGATGRWCYMGAGLGY